jgi:hypothetical protein
MGGIVKSIGKAIKKVGKGIKRIVKKIGPALIVAAAVYTGVALIGAGGMAGGIGSLAPSNFVKGLTDIGKFFTAGSAATTPVTAATQPTLGSAATTGVTSFTETGLGNAQTIANAGAEVAMAGDGVPLMSYAGEDLILEGAAGATSSSSAIGTAKNWIQSILSPDIETTADALVYMTKLNAIQTGASFVLGLMDDSEEKALKSQQEHEIRMLKIRMGHDEELQASSQAHATAMQEAKYSYGGSSGGSGDLSSHPALQPAGFQAQRMPALALPQLSNQIAPQQFAHLQSIGQPTLGRSTTRNFETSVPNISHVRSPGILTQAAKRGIV